MKGEHANWA
jgi:serine/threonine protein kinase